MHDLAATLTNPSLSASVAGLQAQEDESWFRDPQNEWRAQNAAANERLRAMQEQLRSIGRPRDEARLDLIAQGAARMESERSRDTPMAEGREDLERRQRLQRVLSRLNRMHRDQPPSSSYGENAPNHNSLYDWSPPSLADLEEMNEEAEIDTIRRELRRHLPNHHPEVLRVMAENVRADLLRTNAASAQRLWGTQHEGTPARAEQSLRSQAILAAVRRHPRFSARSREYMQRYIADRADRAERSGSGAGAMGSSDSRDRHNMSLSDLEASNRRRLIGLHEDSRSRLRRSLLADPPTNAADASPDSLRRAVTYLSNLRQAETYEDCLGYALDARLATKEFFGDTHDDFMLDLSTLAPLCPSSILSRGARFKGCQRANPELMPGSNRPRRRWERELGLDTYQAGISQEYLPRLTLDDPTRPHSTIPPHAQRVSGNSRYTHPDQWPVEVVIHEVDWERMTLSATMEAQDVPSHVPLTYQQTYDPGRNGQAERSRAESSESFPDLVNADGAVPVEPPRTDTPPPQLPPLFALAPDYKRESQPLKTITTYLEGEILDCRKYTFLTESFASTPANDATYWRKLEPFRDFSEDKLLRKLLSRQFLNELNEKYILMRWKERCFVDDPKASSSSELPGSLGPQTSVEMSEGCGLTISGFYYVCLRRMDGRIEGLYCDPQSSPYQHLILDRSQQESHWWAWEFK